MKVSYFPIGAAVRFSHGSPPMIVVDIAYKVSSVCCAIKRKDGKVVEVWTHTKDLTFIPTREYRELHAEDIIEPRD